MSKNCSTEKYDVHIIEALKKMKMPIVGFQGRKFFFRDISRKESGIEHIAKKSHRLKVRDIESIPQILKHPKVCCQDPQNKIYRNYYGIRKTNDSNTLLKIVTSPVKNKREEEEIIITIYPTKSIKD